MGSSGAVMVTQAVVVTALSTVMLDPLGFDAGLAGILMALLWLFGVAFVFGVPVVSVIAFGAAAAATQAETQRFFLSKGGPNEDPHGLDRDRDGVACETLP